MRIFLIFILLSSNISARIFNQIGYNTNKTIYYFYILQVLNLYRYDTNILYEVQNNTLVTSDDFWKYASDIGNGKYLLPATFLIYVITENNRNLGNRFLSFITSDEIKAFVLSGFITQLLKYSIGRARPYKNLGPYYFRPFNMYTSFHSFPSGHCQSIFSIATIMADKCNIPYVFYPIAVVVAVSRIYNNKHWASDVLIGSFIGIVSAKFINKKGFKDDTLYSFYYYDNKLEIRFSKFINIL